MYRELLDLAERICSAPRSCERRRNSGANAGTEVLAWDAELAVFLERTRHVCGTARRRVLQGQTVPNSEKLFSVFETHTQLYKRGKAAEPVQFGRQVLVYEDGAGFIIHAYLLPRDQDDHDVVVKQTRALQKRLGGPHPPRVVRPRLPFPGEPARLGGDPPRILCLPMPGANRPSSRNRKPPSSSARRGNDIPESSPPSTPCRAGNGLERCRDRTERGFSRYIQLGVLGRNLHVLGKILLAREDAQCKAAQSRRKKIRRLSPPAHALAVRSLPLLACRDAGAITVTALPAGIQPSQSSRISLKPSS